MDAKFIPMMMMGDGNVKIKWKLQKKTTKL